MRGVVELHFNGASVRSISFCCKSQENAAIEKLKREYAAAFYKANVKIIYQAKSKGGPKEKEDEIDVELPESKFKKGKVIAYGRMAKATNHRRLGLDIRRNFN